MSSYDLHRAINITKNTIGYHEIGNAMILKFLDSGFEVRSMLDTKIIVEASDKINGDPITVAMSCFDDLVNEYHDQINDALNCVGFINGYVDGDVLPATGLMVFVIPIPDSRKYEIIF